MSTEQVLLQVGGHHLLPPVEDEVLLNPDQLVCSNTLGHNCIVLGNHVEDVLAWLLWPAMSLSIMTKERF